ncbi:reverse transcrpitase [Danaus plexippus plexippus]|uniref:Reverse transcrpitase n=1 Tax=Danaus plexippus plexippus TaxID=278856 RepID=A0A212ERV5_DANPL|nr:uncharacterized protein LOC116775595 [Danaus plexippus plexippus]OWR44217.1 reverse transcrpitase [Danaus plexippus plexippus]
MERAVREAVALSSARLDARLESLETRLLPAPRFCPPLAFDKKETDAQSAMPRPRQKTPAPEAAVTTLSPPSNPSPEEKKRRKARASAAAKEAAVTRKDASKSQAATKAPAASEWTRVATKKGNKGQKKQQRAAPPQKKEGKKRNLQAPKSAAVGNLNYCARSQDLLDHYAAQWSIDMDMVCEPYRVLPRDNWIGNVDSTVALVFGPNIAPPCFGGTIKGRDYVGGKLGSVTVLGVYFSPNRPLAQFEAFLLQLTSVVNGATDPVIVAGDFNAKSALWGCAATDARGRAMERWMASTDLLPVSRGSVSTCVRQQGESIVDVTLVSSPAAHRIANWRVQEGTETLSDHRFIRFDVISHTSEPASTTPPGGGPRWSVRRLDRNLLEEAAVVASWVPLPSADAAACAEWLNEASRNICDASMRRVGNTGRRRQAYWWRPESGMAQRGVAQHLRRLNAMSGQYRTATTGVLVAA